MSYRATEGYYFIKNLNKIDIVFYDVTIEKKVNGNIIKCYKYKSNYEKAFMMYLDNSKDVVSWAYETLHIPYVYYNIDTKKDETHKYVLDFVYKTSDGLIHLCEIKPYSQTIAPKKSGRKKESTYNNEQKVYVVNMSKWQSTIKYCEMLQSQQKYNYCFELVSENPKIYKEKKKLVFDIKRMIKDYGN